MKIVVNNLQYKKLLKEFREIESKSYLDYPISIVKSAFMPEGLILIDDKLIHLKEGKIIKLGELRKQRKFLKVESVHREIAR